MAEDPELAQALIDSLRAERQASELLVESRARLLDRDALFEVLERELWQGFEDSARRQTERIDELVEEVRDAHRQLASSHEGARELARQLHVLSERNAAVELRLARLLQSLPMRVVGRARELPLVRRVFDRRARRFEAELRGRR